MDEIQAALQENKAGWVDEIEYFESIDSTNTYLMQCDGPIHGRLCITDFQTQGKGRHGKRWLSDAGSNLMFSLGWAPHRPVGAELSLVVGVAIADALKLLGLSNISLKWPNDILFEHAKLAGVLLESRTRGRQTEFVIGIGLNIDNTPDSMRDATRPWVSLRRLGLIGIDRPHLLINIVREISKRLKQLEQVGFAPIRVDWLAFHALQGAKVSYKAKAGNQIGKIVGLDECGALLLEANGKINTVNSGEINTLREIS
jgi:BirA family biotin operon repressor/biotin-[acetyl-CoA-carboxylase] ligase